MDERRLTKKILITNTKGKVDIQWLKTVQQNTWKVKITYKAVTKLDKFRYSTRETLSGLKKDGNTKATR